MPSKHARGIYYQSNKNGSLYATLVLLSNENREKLSLIISLEI